MQIGPARITLNFIRVIPISESEVSLSDARTALEELVSVRKLTDKKTIGGFERLDLSGITQADKIGEMLDTTLAIRYLRDRPTRAKRWFRSITEKGVGKLQLGQPAFFDTMDMIWFYPSILMLRGPEHLIPYAYEAFAAKLGFPQSVPVHTFDPHFLFWMVLEWIDGRKSITNDLQVVAPTSFKVIGIPEYSGGEISIAEVNELLKSLPATTAFLDGLGLRELKATFLIDNEFYASARVYSRGGFWVYLTDYLSRNTSMANRIGLSVLFADRLFEAFKRWQVLPDSEKYPSDGRYDELTSLANGLLDERIREGAQIRRAALRRDRRR